MNKVLYTGIVDDYGLESFTPAVSNGFPYKLRASLNDHRGAVAYVVSLSPSEVKVVKGLIKKESWIAAGHYIFGHKTYQAL